MLFLPLAERLTGRETHLTLLEWGDLHHPLLQRLSLEAPGTYAHTIAHRESRRGGVSGDRRERDARARRRVLPRHRQAREAAVLRGEPAARPQPARPAQADDERVDHPEPRARGARAREEVRSPAAIRAFITEHHGTATIAYFMERARERDGVVADPDGVRLSRPDPAERARPPIVMLADGVEAAARTLTDPTPERIREVIDRVVRAADRRRDSCARRRSRCASSRREARVRARAGRHVSRARRVSQAASRRASPRRYEPRRWTSQPTECASRSRASASRRSPSACCAPSGCATRCCRSRS